jgi:hypothetical protein
VQRGRFISKELTHDAWSLPMIPPDRLGVLLGDASAVMISSYCQF